MCSSLKTVLDQDGSKLFAKVVNIHQKSQLGREELLRLCLRGFGAQNGANEMLQTGKCIKMSYHFLGDL